LLGVAVELFDTVAANTNLETYPSQCLLALAKDGNADYLITGDKDLLTLKSFGKTKIVTLTDFEADLKKTDVLQP